MKQTMKQTTVPRDPAAQTPRIPRRVLLASAVALPTLALTACGGDGSGARALSFTTLAAAGEELARLEAARALTSQAAWSWAQTLEHCAQSIEYSMSGYPRMNSKLFQNTVGAAALRVFAWRGRMSHDLAEPIPGAPALATALEPAAALARLRAAVAAFVKWTGPLQPHFAYGALDKADYEAAHAMHLANHLSQFRAGA